MQPAYNVDDLKAKTATSELGCWEWQKSLICGYGRSSDHRPGGGYAHRAMWIAANGDIPDGLYVLHKCDNRRCINPEHLFLGSHLENIKDMNSKGRQRGGSLPGGKNPAAKFSDEQIIAARWAYRMGIDAKEICDSYGMRRDYLTHVVKMRRRIGGENHGW